MAKTKSSRPDMEDLLHELAGDTPKPAARPKYPAPQEDAIALPTQASKPPHKTTPKTVKRGFLLPMDVAIKLKVYQAEHPYYSMSEIVEEALKEYMKRHP